MCEKLANRPFVAICIMLLLLATVASDAAAAIPKINTKSEKYAALVLDADTGEVFYSRNAGKKRYPASLTKMMTLYLTFEALKSGKLKLDDRLAVSARAAAQPQTNIGLSKGQTIPVKDAIQALVVRSANDVAVVLAEKLGGSEWKFAQKMTKKARSLGMSSTQFRNAHGLPDRQQYTTARDMSRLAIALRRDFPQYYHYFKTKKFVWKGRTYKSHNHVLDRFDGVDGIKTGYINMSGFNLATSVKRDGYHVVAVVMGGQTSRARDSHMVSLLTRTFTTIAERGDQPRLFADAPLPQPKPEAETQTASLPWFKVSFRSGEEVAARAAESASGVAKSKTAAAVGKSATRAAANNQPRERQVAAKTALTQSAVAREAAKQAVANNATSKRSKQSSAGHIRFIASPDKVQQNTLNFQLAKLSNRESRVRGAWGIQVGAFRDERDALKALDQAIKTARLYLKHSKASITDSGVPKTSVHRARLANLSKEQARQACKKLSAHNKPCFVFRVDSRQL